MGDQATKDRGQSEIGRRHPAPNGKGADSKSLVFRPSDDPPRMAPAELLSLQGTIGNQAVGEMISGRPKGRAGQTAPRATTRVGKAPPTATRPAAGVRVQRRDVQHSLAKITNFGISVSDAQGASQQLGHAMDVWVEIDAGKNPVTPPTAPPNSVYGLEFEYWEYVNVTHDNQGATGEKQWNDIHGLRPDASTFTTAAPGCDMTWGAAVGAAANGTLRGKHRIGFRDIPGLWEAVQGAPPLPARNVERTLKFRIVFNDGTRREMFATQLLRIANGHLGYSAYVDSKGNNLESHGFNPNGGYVAGSAAEQLAITNEPNRLNATALPAKAGILAAIPTAAKSAVQGFMVDILQGRAEPYIDFELVEFLGKVEPARQAGGAGDWVNIFSKVFMGDVRGGLAAGQFLVPRIAGTKAVQLRLAAGGMLVALVTGNTVRRLYYTDNTEKAISMNAVPALAAKNWTINLRSFAEIPVEMAAESLAIIKSRSGGTLTNMPLTGEDTHLRAFEEQGPNVIVRVGTTVGPKIKQGRDVAVFQPERRDVTGEWLRAQFGGKTGYVRASKLAGIGPAAAWKGTEAAALPATSGGDSMKTYFEKVFELIATTHAGDHPAVTRNVMAYLRRHPGWGDVMESVYNDKVPPLGLNVPATLAEIVNGHFISEFQNGGNGFPVYNQLATDYPDFGYRLKPAYRKVFSEAQLNTMLSQGKGAADAVADPPNSAANIGDFLSFMTHGPFTHDDFVPTAGGGSGKFDAAFDPITGALDITVRVTYGFLDITEYAASDISTQPHGFGQEFGRNTWTQPEKDNWKLDYVTGATAAFNNAGRTITCTRPGWGPVTATPRFHVREVPFGQQHFVVRAKKAVLTDTMTGKKMQSANSASTGTGSFQGQNNLKVVDLRQFDVYDKFKDPRLHTYLHAIETRTNVEPAYSLDRRRLEEALARLGVVRFGLGAAVLRDQVSKLADSLKRLEIPSSLATLHPIVAKGLDPATPGRGAQTANWVKQRLVQEGVGNPTDVASTGGTVDSVLVEAKPVDPAVSATYVTGWSRFTAAHEYGHMVGLIDEYYGAASAETVKGMISAGWLPADTPADHLVRNPPADAQEKANQEATQKVLNRTGLESPDFAMNAPSGSPKDTSLMSGGFNVTPQHMITAWEALVAMTNAFVNEKYWKIS